MLWLQAGQATEPECVIPLGLAAANAGQVGTALISVFQD